MKKGIFYANKWLVEHCLKYLLAFSPYSKAASDETAEEAKVRENIGKAQEASKTDDEVVQRLLQWLSVAL